MGTAAAIGGVALLSGASTIYGAHEQKKAAEKQVEGADRASQLQAQAAAESLEFQKEQYGVSKELLSPYATGGNESFQRQQALSGALGPEAQTQAFQQYEESPGVAFQREQGLRGIGQNLSARGGLGGGNRLKAISEFNQGLALQDFQNQYNRLGAITQTGLSGAGALSGAGLSTASGVSQTLGQSARGQSQAIQTGANAQAQGIRDVVGTYQSGLADLTKMGGFAMGGGFGK